MSSKDGPHSHSHRPPKHKDKHQKPSNSNRASASKSDPSRDRPIDQTFTSTSTFESKLFPLDIHFEPNISTFIIASEPLYTQEYAADVITGCIGLGLNLPAHMCEPMFDQHGYSTTGHFSYSNIAEATQNPTEYQCLVTDSVGADSSYGESPMTYGYTSKVEDMHGDLAGIGAQFEAQ